MLCIRYAMVIVHNYQSTTRSKERYNNCALVDQVNLHFYKKYYNSNIISEFVQIESLEALASKANSFKRSRVRYDALRVHINNVSILLVVQEIVGYNVIWLSAVFAVVGLKVHAILGLLTFNFYVFILFAKALPVSVYADRIKFNLN
jgi:hypothetical protein